MLPGNFTWRCKEMLCAKLSVLIVDDGHEVDNPRRPILISLPCTLDTASESHEKVHSITPKFLVFYLNILISPPRKGHEFITLMRSTFKTNVRVSSYSVWLPSNNTRRKLFQILTLSWQSHRHFFHCRWIIPKFFVIEFFLYGVRNFILIFLGRWLF